MNRQTASDVVLTCRYGGAVAWGTRYPAPGRDVRKAMNGSAPGYQKVAR